MRSYRIALFTHDTFGLGHVRRTLHFARSLAEQAPDSSILLITGSPAVHVFQDLPKNMDFLKIPTIVKTGTRELQPPHLPIPVREVTQLRSRLIREAVLSFAPDVFLVDNFPLGSRGELRELLEELKTTSTRTVVGLRDILDAPEVVCEDWKRQGIYDVLERLYDRILVYGTPEVMDVGSAYRLSQSVNDKLHYCGYVTSRKRPSSPPKEMDLPVQPFVLATGGGGGDGYPLLKTFAQALEHLPETHAVMITGPLMNSSQQDALKRAVSDRPTVQVLEFVPDLRIYLAAAEVVVSMCGYNTAAEIMAQNARALVVPRTWRYGEHLEGDAAGVEWEQALRSEAFARLGLMDRLDPTDLSPQTLANCIYQIRNRNGAVPRSVPDLQGIENVTHHILSLAEPDTKEPSRETA